MNKDYLKLIPKSLIWFFVWVFIYSFLYLFLGFILSEAFGGYNFFKVKFGYLFLMGLFMSLLSRITYSLINKKHIYIDQSVFFFWTFCYAISIFLFEFFKNLILNKTGLSLLTNIYINAVFVGLGIWICINLIHRMDFNLPHHKQIKAPSQIFTGIILIVGGILCWRFSKLVFLDWLNWIEGMAWSIFIGIALIIAGFLILIAWWRNNVVTHNIGIRFWH